MGCIWSKLIAGGNAREELSEDEAPKQYSWDKREKLDMSNFILDKLSGEVVGRMPGTINGQQFIIRNCENCDIYVFDHCAAVTIDDCTNCRVFLAAIKTSIFVRDSNNCVIATCCQQFRTRDCKKIEALLCCVTQPIIESTTAIKFGCFQFQYPLLLEHLRAAGLSPFNNNWNNIHDFTPVPGENNYAFIKRSTALTEYLPLPTTEPLNSVGLSFKTADCVIPYTVGVKERPPGHGCLVVIFHCDAQHDLAQQIIRQLQDISLVQTAEMKLSEEQIKRVTGVDKNLHKASQEMMILLEFSVHDVELCRLPILAMNKPEVLHVSDSVEAGSREVDCFNNLTEMKMAV
ncbi:protein XRP2-like [Watersipora subatra]|uniref:protein XRP2-like n=1 Tax=Watersipora subatra TaxID=2589382 RepID=UPI00355C51E3